MVSIVFSCTVILRGSVELNLCIFFQLRNELATTNAWHASQTSTASAISFDGMGHLFVERFSSISSGFGMMTITLQPNDESDGLVLYAYDSMASFLLTSCVLFFYIAFIGN